MQRRHQRRRLLRGDRRDQGSSRPRRGRRRACARRGRPRAADRHGQRAHLRHRHRGPRERVEPDGGQDLGLHQRGDARQAARAGVHHARVPRQRRPRAAGRARRDRDGQLRAHAGRERRRPRHGAAERDAAAHAVGRDHGRRGGGPGHHGAAREGTGGQRARGRAPGAARRDAGRGARPGRTRQGRGPGAGRAGRDRVLLPRIPGGPQPRERRAGAGLRRAADVAARVGRAERGAHGQTREPRVPNTEQRLPLFYSLSIFSIFADIHSISSLPPSLLPQTSWT